MARYIALLTFTDNGAKNIKDSTSRAHKFDALAEKSGVRVDAQYWTLGRFDGALVLSADNEKKILHLLAQLAALGNVRTETMQAFVDKEFDAILKKSSPLPETPGPAEVRVAERPRRGHLPPMNIRRALPSDLAQLKRITVEGFDGTSIDQHIEKEIGLLAGRDWRWRKARHIDQDWAANPAGVFVAEDGGRTIGYITAVIDREAGKGRIPNLAVDATARGCGVGRRLLEHALDYFRQEGLVCATIETMANNPVGQHLYPSCGFVEVGRQIHYALKL